MKKIFKQAIACALVLVLAAITANTTPVSAADTIVNVTIANGKLVLSNEAVVVTDIDGDNALTINDALYCAHEKFYNGGAAAGYGSAVGSWGLSMTKLWGIENGGSYGYYVNNASAWSLADPVKTGDLITAFVYQDTVGFSDSYSFFDTNAKNAKSGDSITLTLMGAGYDANWNPVTAPVKDAVITINGKETSYTTDADGKVTIKLTTDGKTVISAVSNTANLVPPVCVVNGLDATSKTGDAFSFGLVLALLAVSFISFSYMIRRKTNEK